MDPVSQFIVGAVAAQASYTKKSPTNLEPLRSAFWVGGLAGLLADADVFIRSAVDPLLAIEYHRHFTHSLLFIPVGALVATLVISGILRAFRNRSLGFGQIYQLAFAGYATHGLLDACTSYGTQLLWPFSDLRVAWNIISIVDPLFTLPLVGFSIAACFGRSWLAKTAVMWGFLYLALGVYFNARAAAWQQELIGQRAHHQSSQMTVKPSFGNILVWRSVYYNPPTGSFVVDSIHAINGAVVEGGDLPRFTTEPQLPVGSLAAQDLERFRWFSDDYLVRHPAHPEIIGDFRYALLPQGQEPLWGISFRSEDQHVSWHTTRDGNPSQVLQQLGRQVLGHGDYRLK